MFRPTVVYKDEDRKNYYYSPFHKRRIYIWNSVWSDSKKKKDKNGRSYILVDSYWVTGKESKRDYLVGYKL